MTTDSNVDNTASAADVFASLRAGRTSHPAATVRNSGSYDGQRAYATAPGAALEAGEGEALAAERAETVSLSAVGNDIAALSTRLAFLNGRLAEGGHDKAGVFAHVVHGSLRAAFETEKAGLDEELAIAKQTRAAVLQRIEAEQARETVRVENEAAEFDFTQGDKRRAQALADAKLKLEAETMAAWLMQRQYGG